MHFTSGDKLYFSNDGRLLAMGKCHALRVAVNLAMSTGRLRQCVSALKSAPTSEHELTFLLSSLLSLILSLAWYILGAIPF